MLFRSTSFLGIMLYLFFQPQILYGIPRIQLVDGGLSLEVQETEIELNNSKQEILVEETLKNEREPLCPIPKSLESYKLILDAYLEANKPFLKKSCSIIYLSQETCIPPHQLSALINRAYGMGFNEFMNRIRIEYIKKNFSNREWSNLTLEGIARQEGFNSRTTFFTEIKKTTGLSPSEFVQNIKASQNNGTEIN